MKNKIIIGIVILIVMVFGGIYYGIYKNVTDRESFNGKIENISNKPADTINQDIANKIDKIVLNGPQHSSNPFDYIDASREIYDELLEQPKETFEYVINDLISSNASKGLNSYIEALLCTEINTNFKYDFETANDYLEHYKLFLNNKESKLNDYDTYAKSLLN